MILESDLIIFCGAGISSLPPSNAPLWIPLRDTIIKKSIDHILIEGTNWDPAFPLEMKRFSDNPILKQLAPEVLFQVLHSSLGQKKFNSILDVVELGKPNKIHKTIADLAANHRVFAIVTTNFDSHIEHSLDAQNIKYEIISDEKEAELWNNSTKTDKGFGLLKLHGSLHKKETIIATVKQAGRVLPHQKSLALRGLISGRHVLIVGYSGRDYDVFPELLEFIREGVPSKVTIISHGFTAWPLNELFEKASIDVSSVEQMPAERLFDQICEKHNIPQIRDSSQNELNANWKEYIQTEMDEVPISDLVMFFGNLALIIGDVRTARSPFFIIARDLVDADLYERKSLDNFRKSAEVHTALARCYVYLGADDLAEDEIELARRRYVELGEDFNFFDTRKLFWCQTNGRGWLLTNQGKLKEGEFKFRNTISAAERFDQKRYLSIDDEALVDAYIGLGDILRLQKEYHESEEAYNQGLLVSREFGSLWLKARAEIALAKLFARNDTKHIALMDDARRCLSFMGLNVENIIDPLMKIEEKN